MSKFLLHENGGENEHHLPLRFHLGMVPFCFQLSLMNSLQQRKEEMSISHNPDLAGRSSEISEW